MKHWLFYVSVTTESKKYNSQTAWGKISAQLAPLRYTSLVKARKSLLSMRSSCPVFGYACVIVMPACAATEPAQRILPAAAAAAAARSVWAKFPTAIKCKKTHVTLHTVRSCQQLTLTLDFLKAKDLVQLTYYSIMVSENCTVLPILWLNLKVSFM